ncbi:hypothetical protein [Halobacterium salinarum]|uniref:hypothetical protein n=1 Tax=Halobacterium salinarum TaxID=2242 RepID=UPI002552BEFE|nr:hypothetical protein [Halobacterium salinarum]MDL0134339.1 hypothetical protein [Halobacterium salinarum]
MTPSSAEATAVQLVDNMDAIISDADDADDGFSGLSELFQRQESVSQVDRAFEDAESFDDLLTSLADFRQSTKHAENSPSIKESTESTVEPAPDGDTIGQKVRQIAHEADPKTVGGYAIGAVIAAGGYAVTAPISTTVGMAAILTGGASAGAYASANPDSQLAEIDPISTAVQMRTAGLARRSNSDPGGYGTRALLSAVDQVDTEELSPAYAKWAAQADIDTIMKDAELAAQAANRSPKSHDEMAARAFGGVVGIAHSYVNAGSGPDLEELVDQDLYQNAVDELNE